MQRNANWTPYIIGAGLITGLVLLLRKKPKMDKLSKNFNWQEFESKDGAPMPDFVKENVQKLVKNLEVIRAAAGAPMRINSGYRSPAHNTSIGGAKNSFHMKGMAADFTIKGKTISETINLIENLIKQGKISEGGLGTYKTFVHYDIQGKKRRWNG
jgi:uncharacterized protein YcbK (DUF882 family)